MSATINKPINPIDNIFIPCLNCNELVRYQETSKSFLY